MVQQASHKPVFPATIAPYIDIGAYIIDARAPAATLYLDKLLQGKELFILNRSDQADPQHTKNWARFFREHGYRCLPVDSATGQGMDKVLDYLATLLKKKTQLAAARGVHGATLRVVALGVPNVGKSTFLNRMIGRKRLRTGNKPGITRGPQWVRLFEDVEVLDTPGVLRNPEALNRRKPYWLLLNLMPYDFELREEAVTLLIERLPGKAWAKLLKYYNIGEAQADAPEPDGSAQEESGTAMSSGRPDWLMLLGHVAARHGFRMSGDDSVDRAARRLISDFQTGRFGRVTLERAGAARISSPLFNKPV
jgi:ribosome biogenesis GTPase A